MNYSRFINVRFFLVPALFIITACSHGSVRSDYGLNHYDELIVSDSQSLLIQPKKLGNGSVEINHVSLIQNSPKGPPYDLQLDKAIFEAGGSVTRALCTTSLGQKSVITIEPDKKYRIDCSIQLNANDNNHLATRDQTGVLKIPYGKSGGVISFNYFLKIEDFE